MQETQKDAYFYCLLRRGRWKEGTEVSQVSEVSDQKGVTRPESNFFFLLVVHTTKPTNARMPYCSLLYDKMRFYTRVLRRHIYTIHQHHNPCTFVDTTLLLIAYINDPIISTYIATGQLSKKQVRIRTSTA